MSSGGGVAYDLGTGPMSHVEGVGTVCGFLQIALDSSKGHGHQAVFVNDHLFADPALDEARAKSL